jgi:hypothetical protein
MKVLSAALLALAFLGTQGAAADRGVGINLSRIEVANDLVQGGGYSLPDFAVINTGDEPAEYEVTIGFVSGQTQRRPDAGWFEFQPRRFSLEPGEQQDVTLRLVLPSGADTGDYFAQVQAQIVTEGTGNSVGVAAAAPLLFTVESSSWWAALRLEVSRFLRDMEPWSYLVEGLLIVTVVSYLVIRYSPYRPRLRFERRR